MEKELVNLERAILFYANIGRIRDRYNNYPYFLKKYNIVSIREWLVKNNFLKLANCKESIPYYPYGDLQSLLKSKGVSAGNSRQKVTNNVEKYISDEEIKEKFGYLCYIPTELGKEQILSNVGNYNSIDLQLNELWRIDSKRYKDYTKEDYIETINIITRNIDESYVITRGKDYLQLSRTNILDGVKINVKLYLDSDFVKEINNITEVYFVSEEKMLLFVLNRVDENVRNCLIYDISKKTFLPVVDLDRNSWDYMWRYGLMSLDEIKTGILVRKTRE